MRAAGWALLLAAPLAACSPLRTTPPETGAGGTSGGSAGATGGGDAGTTGSPGGAGTGGTGGAAGAAGTTGRGGTGGTAGAPPTANLIAHWLFNEGAGTSVADSSGNGQPMTLSATGASWTTAGHEGGGAVTFDGATGFAEMMPTATQVLYSYPVIKLTFSAWVKPTFAASSRDFASAVARAHEDYAFQDFWIGLMNGKPACIIHDQNWEGAVASTGATAGAWTHIACTYATDGTVVLYVNGISRATTSSNETIGPIPPRILVGAAETDEGSGVALRSFFPGAIDDVRIYSETLSAAEVASLAR